MESRKKYAYQFKLYPTFVQPISIACDIDDNLIICDTTLVKFDIKLAIDYMINQYYYKIQVGKIFPYRLYDSNSFVVGTTSGVTVDLQGNKYFTEYYGHRIMKLSYNNKLSVIAGTYQKGDFKDGVCKDSLFFNPELITISPRNEYLYILDTGNRRIRKIYLLNNTVSTLAGGNTAGVQIETPSGIAVDLFGNIYYCELHLHIIRKINRFGVISNVAGTGKKGFVDGPAHMASFYRPRHLAVDKIGNIFVVDSGNNVIRKIEWNTHMVTTVIHFQDVDYTLYYKDIVGITFDSRGTALITDFNGQLWYCLNVGVMIMNKYIRLQQDYQILIESDLMKNLHFSINKIDFTLHKEIMQLRSSFSVEYI